MFMKKISIILTTFLLSTALVAFDLPVFYRAPFFQMETSRKVKKWSVEIGGRYATGSTKKSFTHDGDRTVLFNDRCPFNLLRLGQGLNDLNPPDAETINTCCNYVCCQDDCFGGGSCCGSSCCTKACSSGDGSCSDDSCCNGLSDNPCCNTIKRPETYKYWGFDENGVPNGKFNDPYYKYQPTDGLFKTCGHFDVDEFDFWYKQNLIWGLYFHAYFPYRNIKIDQIRMSNMGCRDEVNGVNMDDFVIKTLPLIYAENCYKKPYYTFSQSGVSDVALSLGWQAYTDKLVGLVTALGGFVQGGVTLPIARRHNENLIFSVPLGYDNHWGIIGRAGAEASAWKFLTVGVQAGAIIFFSTTQAMRVHSDPEKRQNGWIDLARAWVDEDYGSLWDLGGYVKFDSLIRGLAVVVGYSFTSQQRTYLHVEDSCYLRDVRKAALNHCNCSDEPDRKCPCFPYLISQDDVANSNKRHWEWETQTLHAVITYDTAIAFKCPWGALIRLEYDYPITGKHSWAVDMIGGTLGLCATFNI